MASFGQWLRGVRRARGLTQGKLARSCGVTKSYVSRLEHELDHTRDGDPVRPSPEVLDRMARALGVPEQVAREAAGHAPAPHRSLFGEWLLWARLGRGLTQEELAGLCDLSAAYVSLLERGGDGGRERHPSPAVVDRLARALGAAYEEARGAAGYGPPEAVALAVHERELVEKFRALPAYVQLDVEAEIEALHRRHLNDRGRITPPV